MDDKLERLGKRLREAESRQGGSPRGRRPSGGLPRGGAALAGKVATELVAGLVVGGFIGWLLDNWLGTTPLLMVLLLFLGAGAGMMNLWRIATGYGLKAGYFDAEKKKREDE